jgi:hypothetical protein
MKCAHCQTDIADKALICYRCGNPTTAPRIKPPTEGSLFDRPRRSRRPVVLLVILVVAALVAAWLLSGEAWWRAELMDRRIPAAMLAELSSESAAAAGRDVVDAPRSRFTAPRRLHGAPVHGVSPL